MNVTLTKISDNVNALRTDTVEGYTAALPEAGSRFRMYAEGLDNPSLLRLVETNYVVEAFLKDDGDYQFQTASGTVYTLKVNPL